MINKINESNFKLMNLPESKKINVCQKCRQKHGDFKIYPASLEDTGNCSICQINDELINYTVIQLIQQEEIDSNLYYQYGGIRIL